MAELIPDGTPRSDPKSCPKKKIPWMKITLFPFSQTKSNSVTIVESNANESYKMMSSPLKKNTILDLILPNFVFLRFLIFVVKLGHVIVKTSFYIYYNYSSLRAIIGKRRKTKFGWIDFLLVFSYVFSCVPLYLSIFLFFPKFWAKIGCWNWSWHDFNTNFI